ncbi:MAG: hypothetical protein M2R45_01986 [Verrucomicrobia subdivision 3 bacterium]|nr:hypothetical protein [Limisphaerales bacterium]MCS1416147.1 hypothetical protein [Limisphaerales bacterium]
MWLAGGGVKVGCEYGQVDDYCYNIVRGLVHMRGLKAVIFIFLGLSIES